MSTYDVCIVGSGAGGGPVAATLSAAGHRVLVLERGPRFDRNDFVKDEIAICRRPSMHPTAQGSPMEIAGSQGSQAGSGGKATAMFWNGSMVGGSSVLMSGFFMRMKPLDFKPLSSFGPVAGAEVADWPIDYAEMQPWYEQVEHLVGVSGEPVAYPRHLQEPRGDVPFPQPPTKEHPFAARVDETCTQMGLHPTRLARAVLSQDRPATPEAPGRKACDYNGYCGSYGCATGAKGSSLEGFIGRALATGRCDVRSNAMVYALETDAQGEVRKARYFDAAGQPQEVTARIFVVACQAIESARLLLASRGPRHRQGLGNTSGQVGRNLIFCGFGAGWGDFPRTDSAASRALDSVEPFVNRIVQDYYYFDPKDPMRNAGRDDTPPAPGMVKGGTLNFLLMHPNPIMAGVTQSLTDERSNGVPLWGDALKRRLMWYFRESHHLRFETFADWLPYEGTRVSLSTTLKDKWGLPAARVQVKNHPRSLEAVREMVRQGLRILERMGARNPRKPARYGGPSKNLIAGTCRFGDDPRTSVLDRDCKAHDTPNLYVTDASCMPSGGSVPYTFTIYANALRVASRIAERLR